jgi:CRP/FNR family transcriptional regulator
MSVEDLLLLKENHREITYNKGETVFKQGLFVSHIIYLKTGLIKLLIEGNSGKNLIIKFIPSKCFIGFPALSGEDYYPFSAIPVKKSSICLIKKETVVDLIESNHSLCKYILQWCSKEYRTQYYKFSVIGTKNMHGRLAETLIYLSRQELQDENIYQHITRKDIAELSGMSIESALKLLQELKAERIIDVNGKNITINDPEMLKRLSRIG